MTSLQKKIFGNLRYYLFGLYDRLSNQNAFIMSGGLAFSIFACIVPLTLVMLAILSNIFARPEVIAQFFTQIDRIIPYPDMAQPVKDFLSDRLSQTSSVAKAAGIIGFVFLFITATGLFSTLRTVLNTVFKVIKTESVLLGKLWDFALVIIMLIIMIIVMLTLPILETGLELTEEIRLFQKFSITGIQKFIVHVISFFSLFIVYSGIYWLVPIRRPDWRTVAISSAVSTVLWIIAKELFGFYINHAVTVKHIYGVYTFIIISAIWIYYSGLVLIIGAQVGQLYFERRIVNK